MRDIDEYTSNYVNDDFEFIQVEYRRKKVLEVINDVHPANLLEIGCAMKPLFLDLNNVKTTVIEPSKVFWENANKQNITGENIIINDFFDKSFSDRYGLHSFDMIICSGLLHEVENPEELLEAVLAVCNSDTLVHVNVPNARSLHRLIAKEAGLINDVCDKSERNIKLQQNTVFDLNSLIALVEDRGFMVVDKGSYFVKPFTHGQMMSMIDQGIIDDVVLNGLYGAVKYLPEYGSEIFVNIKPKYKLE